MSYVVSFILGILISVLLGVDFSTASEAPTSVWIVGMILTVILGVFFALWYFKTIKPSWKEGLYLGLIFIGVGIFFDLLFIIPYILLSDSPADPFSYYTNIFFWLSLILLLASTTFIGYWKGKK